MQTSGRGGEAETGKGLADLGRDAGEAGLKRGTRLVRHANTQTLLAYWEARRKGGSAPVRGDITPNDLGALLSHLFLLRRMDRDHHVFRLAGAGLCRLHRREFRDQNFLSLWSGHDRAHMAALLEGALSTPAPASAVTEAASLDGRAAEVEIALLPLRGPEGWLDRVLGLYQPLTPGGLGGRPIVRHRLVHLNPARAPDASVSVFCPDAMRAPPALAANDG